MYNHLFNTSEFCLAASALSAIVAVQNPDKADLAACIGAMFATALASIKAREKDKSHATLVSVMLSSAFVGCVAPGVYVHRYDPSLAQSWTWHSWVGAGFVAGLMGWGLVKVVMSIWESGLTQIIVRKFLAFFKS